MVVSKSPFPSIHFKKLVAIRYLRYESYETLKQPTKRWGWTHKSSGPKHVEASAPPPPPVVGTPAPLQDPNFIDPAWYAWKPQGRTRVFKKNQTKSWGEFSLHGLKREGEWMIMDSVFWDGLKENQLSLDQLGRISILTFSVVWVLKGDADRIWRQQANFFSELGSRTILEA